METKSFIEKAKEVHGNKYDYSKVEYINNRTKVCIICPKHGEFWQSPYYHLKSIGCKFCGYNLTKEKQRKHTETFISEVKAIYGNKYDYSKVEYINSKTKVCIICHEKDEFGEEHGEFFVTPNNFLRYRECPKCKKHAKLTKEIFEKKAKLIHGDKYNYSESEIKTVDDKVKIICPMHGEFWQTPYKHLIGRGCPKCANIKRGISNRNNFSELIEKFNNVHNFKYDYSESKYKGVDTKIKIICPKHGEFWQIPYSHLNGCGCPKCNESKLEKEIREFLEKNQIEFFYRNRKINWLNGLELDFYLPDYNVAIECQGVQHFKPTNFGFKNQKQVDESYNNTILRDKTKKLLCEKNGIKLLYYSNLGIEYPYKVFEDKEKLLNEIKKKI